MNSDNSSEEGELHDIDWEEYEEPLFAYKDPYTVSPQIAAAAQNDVPRLRTLIESGKSVNINDNKGYTPIMVAILQDSKEAFEYLLTVEDIRLDVENFDLENPLLLSLRKEDTFYAKQLLEHGVDPNAGDKHSVSNCLYYALEFSQPLALCEEYCCMLLMYGADPHVRDTLGNIPFNLSLKLELPLLQEVLFNYTFDDLTEEWDLKTFLTAMNHNSPYLDVLLDRNYELYYEEMLHEVHRCVFGHFKASPTLRLIQKYKRFSEELFSFWSIYVQLLVNPLLNHYQVHTICKEKLKFLFELSHTKYLADIIETINNAHLRNESIVNIKLSEDESIKLFFVYLSLGYEPIEDDFEKVYLRYGPEEFFKLLLHFKPKIADYEENSSKNVAKLYYNLHFDKEILETQQHSVLGKFFKKAQPMNGNCRIPSLLELARNEAREFLIQKYKIKNNVQFYTILHWLPINNIAKEYITYMKPTYNL